MQALLGDDAKLERVSDENGDAPAARSASDFSYASEGYAGRGWRVVGDAGGECVPLLLVDSFCSLQLLLKKICLRIRADNET